MNAHTKPDK